MKTLCRKGLHEFRIGSRRCIECRNLWKGNVRSEYNSKQRDRYKGKYRFERSKRYLVNRHYFLRQVFGKCELCGFSENTDILQFDHIKPLNGIKGRRFTDHLRNFPITSPRLWDYFNDVQVLCPNCHATKTWNETRDRHKDLYAFAI